MINRNLDGKVINCQERSYCTILTNEEEECIVSFLKNKNRCMQAVNEKDREKLILEVLRIRKYTNKKMGGGRKYQKLSNNAKSALEKVNMFNSIKREAHMLILSKIWQRWATKERLINAIRRVGITNKSLSVEFMQQDKFKRVKECM